MSAFKFSFQEYHQRNMFNLSIPKASTPCGNVEKMLVNMLSQIFDNDEKKYYS